MSHDITMDIVRVLLSQNMSKERRVFGKEDMCRPGVELVLGRSTRQLEVASRVDGLHLKPGAFQASFFALQVVPQPGSVTSLHLQRLSQT